MTTQQLREDAAAVLAHLEQVGWIGGYPTGSGVNDAGNVCLFIAASNSVGLATGITAACRKRLNIGSLTEWNDTPGRTWDDVRSLLRDIIESN